MSAACPEYAFEIEFHPARGAAPDAEWLATLEAVLAARGLSIAYTYPSGRRYLVIRDGGQVVEADLEALRVWRDGQGGKGTIVIGPLIELNELE